MQPTSSPSSSQRSAHQPGFLRIADFMIYSGLGRSKVYDLIQKGEIQTVKVGHATLIPRASIEQWEAALLGATRRRSGAV